MIDFNTKLQKNFCFTLAQLTALNEAEMQREIALEFLLKLNYNE
jgi:hypothetical protein